MYKIISHDFTKIEFIHMAVVFRFRMSNWKMFWDKDEFVPCMKYASMYQFLINTIDTWTWRIPQYDIFFTFCLMIETFLPPGGSSHVVSSSSIHLVSSLELLVSHTTYFMSSLETGKSTMLAEVRHAITDLVKSMTSHVVIFLKVR